MFSNNSERFREKLEKEKKEKELKREIAIRTALALLTTENRLPGVTAEDIKNKVIEILREAV